MISFDRNLTRDTEDFIFLLVYDFLLKIIEGKTYKFSAIIKIPYPQCPTHIRTSVVTTGRHWIETKTPDFFHLLFLFFHIICSFFEVDKTLLINEC